MTVGKTIIPASINSEIQKERNGASLNSEEFAEFWHGGKENLKFKRFVEKYLDENLDEDTVSFHYKSHEEMYDNAIEHSIKVAQLLMKLQKEYNPGGTEYWPDSYFNASAFIPAGNPFGVQVSMVVKALKHHSTDDQFNDFGKTLERFSITAAYAQTELGHGTYLRGLETRADYDRKTDEFVLNTPTISSYKWWPGGLGHSANHCIVVATLYIDNISKGVQLFWVPIRDLETHMPLAGIEVGEIGKRIGFYGVDNGYLGLKNVRIPRKYMLMRNNKVDSKGLFVQSPLSVLNYFSMVYIRCLIAHDNAKMLAQAATIATRYSAVRRQSPINPNEPERQIMDHLTQQLKLFPEIATSVAFRLAANYLGELYQITSENIQKGEYTRMPELHALACAMKALGSYTATQGIERLRLACGGHGYLTAANLGPLFVAASAACTYEGENTVLLLQVGRFLMKSYRNALAGKVLPSTISYLSDVKQQQFGEWSGSLEQIVKAMQFAATYKITVAFENWNERLKAGQTQEEASNNTGIEYCHAATLHGLAFVCSTFLQEVVCTKSNTFSPALRHVMENLLELYLVQTALNHISDIMRCISLTDAHIRQLQTRLENVLNKIRPDAVAIVDGFDFCDRQLGSALGASDGNVYERIFESAQNCPLNKEPVPKTFYTHLKPFMKSNM